MSETIDDDKLPAQSQDAQPGSEQAMEPRPQSEMVHYTRLAG